MPVCPQPSAAQLYYQACVPGGRLGVMRLLFDLAVDQTMKADTDPIRRHVGDLLRAAVSEDTIDKNDALRDYLDHLPPLNLTKLDTATGTLQLNVADESRHFEGTIDTGTSSVNVSWDLPTRLSGGYWRTPNVLQIAFWQGQRARIRIGVPEHEFSAEIECLVISGDGIRAITSGADTPHILVRFDECG